MTQIQRKNSDKAFPPPGWTLIERLKGWLLQESSKIKLQTFALLHWGQVATNTRDDFWCQVYSIKSCVSKLMSCSDKVNNGVSLETRYLPAEQRARYPFYCLFRGTDECFHQPPCANSTQYRAICIQVYITGNICQRFKQQHLILISRGGFFYLAG